MTTLAKLIHDVCAKFSSRIPNSMPHQMRTLWRNLLEAQDTSGGERKLQCQRFHWREDTNNRRTTGDTRPPQTIELSYFLQVSLICHALLPLRLRAGGQLFLVANQIVLGVCFVCALLFILFIGNWMMVSPRSISRCIAIITLVLPFYGWRRSCRRTSRPRHNSQPIPGIVFAHQTAITIRRYF